MISRRVELSRNVVFGVVELIRPDLSEREEPVITRLADRTLFNLRALGGCIQKRGLLLEAAEAPILAAYAALNEAQATKVLAENYIAPNPKNDLTEGRLGVIIGRIRVKLNDPNLKLPKPLGFLRRFALGEHPFFSPYVENERQANQAHTIAVQEAQSEKSTINRTADAKIIAAAQAAKEAQFNFFKFCDPKAALSRDRAAAYVGIVPQRTERVAELFASKTPYSQDELDRYFRSFVEHISSGLPNHLNAFSQANKRHAGILSQDRIDTQTFANLPTDTRKLWVDFVKQQLIAEWTPN